MEICLDTGMEESESESTDHEIIFDEEEMLTVRPKITARTFTRSTLNVGSLVKDLSDYAIKNHEQGTVKLMTLEAAKKYKVENLDVKKNICMNLQEVQYVSSLKLEHWERNDHRVTKQVFQIKINFSSRTFAIEYQNNQRRMKIDFQFRDVRRVEIDGSKSDTVKFTLSVLPQIMFKEGQQNHEQTVSKKRRSAHTWQPLMCPDSSRHDQLNQGSGCEIFVKLIYSHSNKRTRDGTAESLVYSLKIDDHLRRGINEDARDTCMHKSYPVTLDPELALAAQKAVLDLQTLRDPRTLIKRFDGLQTRFRVLLSERYVA